MNKYAVRMNEPVSGHSWGVTEKECASIREARKIARQFYQENPGRWTKVKQSANLAARSFVPGAVRIVYMHVERGSIAIERIDHQARAQQAAQDKRIAALEAEYMDSLGDWNWKDIKAECVRNLEPDADNPGQQIGRSYLGSVLTLTPSGKFYMPWTSNQTDEDELQDSVWYERLEAIAAMHGLSIENGDGDPCDLFAYIIVDQESANNE